MSLLYVPIIIRRYYEFKGHLVFDPASHDVINVDRFPRYRIKPLELLTITEWSTDESSRHFGYRWDPNSGLYLRNMDAENGDCEIEFLAMSMNPPFNYTDDESYSDYISMSFSRSYQNSLRRRFDSTPKKIKNSTDGTSHTGGVFTHIEEKMGSRFSDVTKKPDSNFKYLT